MCFSDLVPEPKDRYNVGYSFIAMAFVNVAVHLLLIITANYVVIRNKIRARYAKKSALANAKKTNKEELYSDEKGQLRSYDDFFNPKSEDKRISKRFESFFAV